MSKSIFPNAVLVALSFTACASAAELRPDQEAAIEKILATVEPSAREMARPMIEESIAALPPEQVAMMVAGAAKNSASTQVNQATPLKPKRVATPEDLAYNRAQYEPALLKHWEAKRAFDKFVDAELVARCPNRDTYAVYREVERYELMALSPQWQRATDYSNAEVDSYGKTYPPKGGRYDFDFSKVRMTFDKAAVSNAISKACADWTTQAAAFKEKAQALMNSGQSQAAHNLERSASSKVSAINESLQAALIAQSPAGEYNEAMFEALRKPNRVN